LFRLLDCLVSIFYIFSSPAAGQRPSKLIMPWCGVRRLASVCQLFPLKFYYSKTAEQNVTKFGVKRHWGKGNQFCINEGAVPRGARGAGPNRADKDISFKDYSRTAEQNVPKWCEASLGEGESVLYKRRCWSPRGTEGWDPMWEIRVYLLKTTPQEWLNRM